MNSHEFLSVMRQHRGSAQGAGVSALARAHSLPERRVRELVSELREDGVAVCAHPSTGYFLPETADELQQSIDYLEHRAKKSLMLAARMRAMSLPGLPGRQMALLV